MNATNSSVVAGGSDLTSLNVPMPRVAQFGSVTPISLPSRSMENALSGLSSGEIESQIGELTGHLNAAQYRWLTLIAEFDRRGAWAGCYARSCAHWLNFRCGIDLGAAREKLRVARALEALPAIAAAMASGELSYSKARALTRVAGPETEAELLSMALHGTASHVERLVRSYRQVQEVAERDREARQHAGRSVSWLIEDDGSLSMRIRLTAEAGAVVLRALEAADEELAPAPRVAGVSKDRNVSAETPSPRPVSRTARRADAFVSMAESYLGQGGGALSGGDRQQIVVHVDAVTLRHGHAGRCELEEGPSLAAETARRLACDASLVTMIEDEEGNALDVGRKTRSIPPALRRALKSRDQGCRFPGCTHIRHIDGHHIEHWADGGATRLSNLVSLCRFHHRLLHEGQWQLRVLDDGALQFVDAGGTAIARDPLLSRHPQESAGSVLPVVGAAALVADHARLGISIDARTSATRWRGERMDYGLAIDILLQRLKPKHAFQ